MSDELLPCPFTGEKPKHGLTKKMYCQLTGESYQHYFVDSMCCRIERPTKGLAFKAWNTRAVAKPVDVESLKQKADKLAEALACIVRHLEITLGPMAEFSAVKHIAEQALSEYRGGNDGG